MDGMLTLALAADAAEVEVDSTHLHLLRIPHQNAAMGNAHRLPIRQRQNTAIGFTGEPVPPITFSGLTLSMNS